MRNKIKKKILIIRHQHNIGGQIADRRFWEGAIEGETDVWDWHTKENLKKQAEEAGMGWRVLRYHRDGTISIMEESK